MRTVVTIPWAAMDQQMYDLLVFPSNSPVVQCMGVKTAWLTANRFRARIDQPFMGVIRQGIEHELSVHNWHNWERRWLRNRKG